MPRKQSVQAPVPVVGRHRDLLTNPKIREWYDGRLLRSRLSADTYLRQLGLFVERLGLDADMLARTARNDPDRLRAMLTKLASKQKRGGLLDAYISKSFGGLKSWFEFNHVRFDGYPKLSPVKGQSLVAERVPTPEEFARILERLSPRGRVVALLMGHSGLRPGVIGSYGGEDGLRLRDLELNPGPNLEFPEIPFVIRVPAALSKTRATYVTFGTATLATTLTAYLESRRERGEDIGPQSPVVAAAESRGIARSSREASQFGKGFLTTKAVVEELREALRVTVPDGVTWRPYVCRSYCSTRLLLAEGEQKITRDLREAILGHDGGVASRYTVGKRWGPELLAEARKQYRQAAEFLEGTSSGKTAVYRDLLQSLLDDIEASTGKASGGSALTVDQLKQALQNALGRSGAGSPGGKAGSTGTRELPPPKRMGEERVIEADMTEAYLDLGWKFRSPLNGSKAVVEWGGGDLPPR
jgi:hypothetical protein